MADDPKASRSADAFLMRHQAELRLSARMTVAALLAYALGEALGLVQSYWAVLTAIIVMQANVGGSLKATVERLIGTIGGSLWGLAVTLTVPHNQPLSTGIALFAVAAPLTILAAFRPGLRVAPITGVVILLSALASQGGPVAAALNRTLEIALGCALAFFVSLTVLPARAHRQLAELAGEALGHMGAELIILTDMLRGRSEGEGLDRERARIRTLLVRLEAVTEEAERERANHLSDGPDPRPVMRTLRRVRNDLVILARAAVLPLPEPVAGTLGEPLDEAGRGMAALLQESGTAFARIGAAPSGAAAMARIDRFAASLAALRKEGVLRTLPDEALARLFSVSFAFDQLRQNIIDLAARADEFYRWKTPVLLSGKKDA